ncbi:MAG: GAF domain-containing protein, partial [Candidatus Rokuibacteriota bacterium]
VDGGAPLRADDLAAPAVPPASREAFAARGYRSAVLAPLSVRGAVAGAVTVAARLPGAFDDADVEIVAELAQPLAAAIEQRRLLEESSHRAEELAALLQTSRLVSARLELPAVLEAISRAATALTGGTGCGIGLLDAEGRRLAHAAAHGFKSDEWRALSIAVGEGIIGRCAATGEPVRIHDIARDPRSVRRDVDEREAIRSLLCVPMRAAGALIGVISAISTVPGAFRAHHQALLEAFAEQAGIAIHNARLYEERVRHARETRALLEAGRAVTASLDVQETIRVIITEARSVLGAASCGLLTLEPATGDLVGAASLDLPPALAAQIRLKPGEGIGGRAFSERRPVQSEDLARDPRLRFPELTKASALRSMLAAPLRVGDRAVGVIYVFRNDVHRYSPDEEALLLALADQAAIALEHARLYRGLEDVVAERTRELDEQKRFVEVVLETLPIGVFVLDDALRVVRANGHGIRVLGCATPGGSRIIDLVPPERQAGLTAFLRETFAAAAVRVHEQEVTMAGEARIFRLTAAPFESGVAHLVLLVEDVTLAKRIERQMVLTERLTTAGRMAAGVAHELNNPLATIAGCAEALLARTREAPHAGAREMDDFRHYLGLIEEEAYRCKDITGSLLHFVREPDSRRTPTDLHALVAKTVELLAHQKRFAGRRVVTEPSPDLPRVTVNEGQLRQVFLGIAANALEAMDADGVLTIRTRRLRDEVEVEFEDAGPGIPDEILSKVFDPFFTTKPPGQGTGLGLAIAQGIVTDHGGRIDVTSRVGKGAIFRVALPA